MVLLGQILEIEPRVFKIADIAYEDGKLIGLVCECLNPTEDDESKWFHMTIVDEDKLTVYTLQ